MDDLTGKTIGRYQVSSLIGRGGMATVYKAHDPSLDRAVALKLLLPQLSADPAFVARFRREARAVAALRHPNIVQVHEFDSADGEYFMVMEFVDGPTLATLLKRLNRKGRRLSREDILRIFPPLCSAIDYANREGMVHRDIKPSNIILTRKGDPVVTDYGIAKVAGATSYTMPGTVVGSAQYMSPEQAQGLPADNRSDIYSLGVCLFEALTGRVPFDGETTASVLAQHLTAPVPSALAFNPELPLEVEAVLARVLAKKPADRYQLAADLARDLEAALQPPASTSASTSAPPPTSPLGAAASYPVTPYPWGGAGSGTSAWPESPPPMTQAPRRRRRWPLVIVVVAVVLAVVMVGVALLVRALSGGTGSTITLPGSSSTTFTTSASSTSATTVVGSSSTAAGSSTSTLAAEPVDLSSRAALSASSVRAAEGSTTYEPASAIDNDPTTCWVEGVPGYGEGQWVLFRFPRAVTATEIRIIPGLDKVKAGWDRWWSNGRVHTFRLEFSDGSSEEHTVADTREMQTVVLGEARRTTSVRFTIVSVYPAQDVPNKADDTCVSELHVWGTQ